MFIRNKRCVISELAMYIRRFFYSFFLSPFRAAIGFEWVLKPTHSYKYIYVQHTFFDRDLIVFSKTALNGVLYFIANILLGEEVPVYESRLKHPRVQIIKGRNKFSVD